MIYKREFCNYRLQQQVIHAVAIAAFGEAIMATELPITQMVIAVGALGTAAFGIVDGFKFIDNWAAAGFKQIRKTLGEALFNSMHNAYGNGFEAFLRAQYINGRSSGEVVRSLRQGVRLGLTGENAAQMASSLGHIDPETLQEAASKVDEGTELNNKQRSIIARFEVALDARVDAALALAESKYKAVMQVRASIVAIVLSVIGSIAIHIEVAEDTGKLMHTFNFEDFVIALIVGVVAVPLAPIAKDVASALQSVAVATRVRAK